MANPLRPTLSDNAIGAMWMVGAMTLFAVEDALLKHAATVLPMGQALGMFGLFGLFSFVTYGLLQRTPVASRAMLSPLMAVRFGFEVTGRLFYFLAIALTSLSSATIILQATPLVVVAAAAILFKEKVGLRRWAAIGLGFMGVLVILRPGAEGFGALSILAVIGLIGFAGRDLTSRMAPASIGPVGLGVTGFAALSIAGGLYSLWTGEAWVVPSPMSLVHVVLLSVIGVVAYSALMQAMRTGDVSAVTPFRYSRLLSGIALGVIWFGERLDVWMILGSTMIVVSGLFILWRGRAVTKV